MPCPLMEVQPGLPDLPPHLGGDHRPAHPEAAVRAGGHRPDGLGRDQGPGAEAEVPPPYYPSGPRWVTQGRAPKPRDQACRGHIFGSPAIQTESVHVHSRGLAEAGPGSIRTVPGVARRVRRRPRATRRPRAFERSRAPVQGWGSSLQKWRSLCSRS